LRFLAAVQGHAVVRGKHAFCTTWVVHGEMLGIRVIPEIPRTLLSYYLFGHLTAIVWAAVAFSIEGFFPSVKLWQAIGIGWVAAAIVMGVWMGDDRKRGKALLNNFPQTATRGASIDDARARGML
jgi:hypothetical protein